jgi:pimeloyl-ACP methyl ester carboxylesterase
LSETFLLVHGSWHGGWAWEGVSEHLEREGHRTVAPTLAGHGPGASRAGVRHADCVDTVASAAESMELDDITLVGHSFGGSVISKVAERIPERIARLVFFTAFVLEDGQSIVDNLPREQVEEFERSAAASSDNTVECPWDIFRDAFMQDAGEEQARAVWSRLAPQPYATWTDKLDLGRFYSLDIPRTYIACRDDLALDPGGWHPGMSSRLGSFDLREMPGSHEVMFTNPEAVAQQLIAAAVPTREEAL